MVFKVHMVLYEYDLSLDRCCIAVVMFYVFGTSALRKYKAAPVTQCHRCLLFYEENRLRYVNGTYGCGIAVYFWTVTFSYVGDLLHYNNDITYTSWHLKSLKNVCLYSILLGLTRKCCISSLVRMVFKHEDEVTNISWRDENHLGEKNCIPGHQQLYNADHHHVTPL